MLYNWFSSNARFLANILHLAFREINENKPIRNFIWNEGVFLGIVFK